MPTMATNIRGGLTRLQVGTAACAVAAAAAFPAVVANADSTVQLPAAPISVLGTQPLGPITTIAEQGGFNLEELLDDGPVIIDRVRPLVFLAVGAVLSPLIVAVAIPQLIAEFADRLVDRFFAIGGYGRGGTG